MNTKSSPEPIGGSQIDFSDTQIAFSNKSDKELKKMAWLFSLMNKPTLTTIGSKLGLVALKLRLPFVESILKKTIFEQFCGGENLLDCQPVIDHLYKYDTLTVLDYGAEGKSEEADLDHVMEELINAVELAASNNSVPVIVAKVTGLVANEILEKMQSGATLELSEQRAYDRLLERLETICERADELKVGVFMDAEESWIQDAIDDVAMQMMEKFNHEYVVVYNTYQLYRHDKLAQLKSDHQIAKNKGFILGAKVVRGAYMQKEKDRAEATGKKSPIQPNKAATDRDFNEAIRYCVENYETLASCNATHNLESNRLQIELIDKHGIDKNHRHLNFCQLYGMSDYITFNIANAGYNVAKYLPYGHIREVVPYLIRRAQENTSVTGEMSRELSYIDTEVRRRGMK